MKVIKGGQRQLNKGERFEQLESVVQNQAMALQITQSMVSQMGEMINKMRNDLGTNINLQRDLEYKIKTLQALNGLSDVDLATKADQYKLTDYMTASDKEDTEKSYTVKNHVDSAEDVVLLTSNTPDLPSDKGIFRSKLHVQDLGPELSALVIGKSVGDVVETTLVGDRHLITILGVREVPKNVDGQQL